MKILVAAVALAAIATTSAIADPGHTGDVRAYGSPGTPDHPMRTIRLDMKETDTGMVFNPKVISVRKGEQIRFLIRNTGHADHELVVGTLEENLEHGREMAKNPDMEHDDPNAIRLGPGHGGEILWMFSNAGEFDFSCLLPGHRESGMFGTIIVR